MSARDPLLILAERVSCEGERFGIPMAVIGALALAHHGYVRATLDVDFATSTDFDTKLRALGRHLASLGLTVELRAPDPGDPIDGVMRVRETAAGDPVDVLNFAGSRSLGALAVARAHRGADGFSYARIPELVALKLYAGSRFDRDDVARLLSEAPDLDLEEVRRVCEDAKLGDALREVLDRIAAGTP